MEPGYREYLPSDPTLAVYVSRVWTWRSRGAAPGGSLVVPDASFDLIFKRGRSGVSLLACGVMTRARSVASEAGAAYLGIRFRPGFGAAFIDTPLASIRDDLVELPDYFAQQARLLAMLEPGATIDALIAEVSRQLRRRAAERHDPRAVELVRRMAALPGDRASAPLARSLGLARRSFHRVFTRHFGIGPRLYTSIMRFQRMQAVAAARPGLSIGELAAASGYYDQPDMSRTVKRLTGMTPARYLARTYKT